jgi:diguanylate cyclase (GGDEF)-like protein/putative nucleotidyltransferase with HDIG domain
LARLLESERRRADLAHVLKGKQQLTELGSELAGARHRIAQLETERDRLAGRDAVTGKLNLRTFRAKLETELDRTRRHGRPITVVLLDLDGFRAINGQHGHVAGDALLLAVGGALEPFLRPGDVLCRTGGDEFAVLLLDTDETGAEQSFVRVLRDFESLSAGPVRSVSASVGVAAHRRGQTAAGLINAASSALQRARAAGGGRVSIAGQPAVDEAPVSDGHRDVIGALASALTERDRYTGDHSHDVVEMAGSVAERLGLSAEEVHHVRAAALLHDIGKVAIPDHILNKPGKLDDEEWKLMRQHPEIGERILRAIPGLGSIARIVRHEHESFDGGGYPDKLAGDQIPIGSRIILACDAYHAMITDRPYRKGMSHREAVDELARCAGKQFDPDVTGILIGYLHGLRQTGQGDRLVTAEPAPEAA